MASVRWQTCRSFRGVGGGRSPVARRMGGRGVLAGDGEASRGPGEDAFLAGPVLEPGDQGQTGGAWSGQLVEVGGLEQDEVAFGAGDVIQEAGLRNCRTGRPMKKARSGGQSWKV